MIGASTHREAIGGIVFRNLLAGEFKGAAYPVNRTGEPVAGVRRVHVGRRAPRQVDLAVICLPGAHVLDAARSALEEGIRALCVSRPASPRSARKVASTGAVTRARPLARGPAIGPNCLGIAVAAPSLNATFGPRTLPPGPIAFSSQSGALGLALLEKASERSLGFSSFISIGNKADVSSNDLLEYWEDDDDTGLIALYLESFGNPRRFGQIASRVARVKPILRDEERYVQAGARAAGSHTAALAGSEQAVEALFHQAGVLRAGTLEELIDAAALLSTQPLPRGRRVAILTNAGGLGILCSDACEAAGLELSELSVETTSRSPSSSPVRRASRSDRHARLGDRGQLRGHPPARARRPGRRLAIVLFVPPATAGAEDVAAGLVRTLERCGPRTSRCSRRCSPQKGSRRCCARLPGSPRSSRTPNRRRGLSGSRRSAPSGCAGLRGSSRRSTGSTRPPPSGIVSAADDRWLDAGRDKRAAPAPTACRSSKSRSRRPVERGRRDAAREIGFPVVVKSGVAGAHKTETGGVALDLGDEAAVREAAERIGAPVVVQQMVQGGTELLAGIVQDPDVRPARRVRPGRRPRGADRRGGLPDRAAHRRRRGGSSSAAEARPARPAATGEPRRPTRLPSPISSTGSPSSARTCPRVAELDLNPVLAGRDGCVVVDARVRIARPSQDRRVKTW